MDGCKYILQEVLSVQFDAHDLTRNYVTQQAALQSNLTYASGNT
jgi:hypothetical protein